MSRRGAEGSSGSEVIPCDALPMGTRHYTLARTHGVNTTKSEPQREPWTLGGCEVLMWVRGL